MPKVVKKTDELYEYSKTLVFSEPTIERSAALTEAYDVLSNFRLHHEDATRTIKPEDAKYAHDVIQNLLGVHTYTLTDKEIQTKFKQYVKTSTDITETLNQIAHRKLIRYNNQLYMLSYIDGEEIILDRNGNKAKFGLKDIADAPVESYHGKEELQKFLGESDPVVNETELSLTIDAFKSFEFLEVFVRNTENKLTRQLYKVTPSDGEKLTFSNVLTGEKLTCDSKRWKQELQDQQPNIALLRSYHSQLFAGKELEMTSEYFPTKEELASILKQAITNRDIGLIQMLSETDRLSEGLLNPYPELLSVISKSDMRDLKELVSTKALFTEYLDRRTVEGNTGIQTNQRADVPREEVRIIKISDIAQNPTAYQAELLEACRTKNIDKVNVLLSYGVNPNFKINGKTPLMEVLQYSPSEVEVILGEDDQSYKELLRNKRDIQKQLREDYNRNGIETVRRATEEQISNPNQITENQLTALRTKIASLNADLAKCTELETELESIQEAIREKETAILNSSLSGERPRMEIITALIQAGTNKQSINEHFKDSQHNGSKKTTGSWSFAAHL